MQKVVILMSTYNGERYIVEQIDSILLQTYENIELIVRDDGSTDSTLNILESYAKKGKLTWYQGENIGPANSFMELVSKSPEADFYSFADQDDYWLPEKIEVAVKGLNQHSWQECPLLYCSNIEFVGEDLEHIPAPNIHLNRYKDKERVKLAEALIRVISPGCTYVFNKKVRDVLCMYEWNMVCMHDALVFRCIAALGEVIYDATPHMKYRQHKRNFSGSGATKWKQKKRLIRGILRATPPNIRFYTAIEIEEQVGQLMSKDNQMIIRAVTNYRNGLNKRISLVFNKEFQLTERESNILFRLTVLLNKF